MTFAERRQSFGTSVDADVYDRMRPVYPDEAVAWLIGDPPGALDVLDLGAGTGILSRSLVVMGHRVVAVDPSEPMLAVLRRQSPLVDVRLGSGEDIPLDDRSVDAVVIGQAWHWMNAAAAASEIARVLRPGAGRLGLAWNAIDTAESWTAHLDEITSPPGDKAQGLDDDDLPRVPDERFGDAEQRAVHWVKLMPDAKAVADLASTWSWVALNPERDRLIEEVRELAGSVAEPDGTVRLPYVTYCFRWRRG